MAKRDQPKRHVFRIEITKEASEVVAEITDKLGITQIAIASKLVLWFDQQPELIQQAIIGLYPDAVEQDAGELVVRRMADTVSDRRKGLGTQ